MSYFNGLLLYAIKYANWENNFLLMVLYGTELYDTVRTYVPGTTILAQQKHVLRPNYGTVRTYEILNKIIDSQDSH